MSFNDQEKCKCFGNQAGLCAEAVVSKSGYPTVNLEVAPRQGNNMLWDQKVILQMSAQELPILAATLLGYRQSCEFKRQTKGIQIERQASSLFIKASEGRILALPVVPGDVFRLSSIVLNQLMKSSPCNERLMLTALKGISVFN